MLRIICIGNRYHPADQAGMLVFDRLGSIDIPSQVELIDGGLGGIDLLRFFEDSHRVIVVDSVSGFRNGAGVVVLDPHEIARSLEDTYGHSGGLACLFRVLPQVCHGPLPEIHLVGIEGDPDLDMIREAAALSLKLALEGSAGIEPGAVDCSGALA